MTVKTVTFGENQVFTIQQDFYDRTSVPLSKLTMKEKEELRKILILIKFNKLVQDDEKYVIIYDNGQSSPFPVQKFVIESAKDSDSDSSDSSMDSEDEQIYKDFAIRTKRGQLLKNKTLDIKNNMT